MTEPVPTPQGDLGPADEGGMTMVDDGAAGPLHAGGRRSSDRVPRVVPVPCVARPGAGLTHLDGVCRCFCGGPPPVFRDDLDRVPTAR